MAARGFDPEDSFSRVPRPGDGAAPWATGSFSFGVLATEQFEFFGDEDSAALYRQAIRALERTGGRKVPIDFSVFRAAADLLQTGPWVAEQYAALHNFYESHSADMEPGIRSLLGTAGQYSAADTFEAQYRLAGLRRAAETQWESIDVLVLPTAGTNYTHQQAAADPAAIHRNLSYYTSFVSLMDLAAAAVPAGFRPDGLPFGISLIGPNGTEEALLALADRFHRSTTAVPGPPLDLAESTPACIAVAVVGSHLTGQPLNSQLTERGAQLIRACRTAPGYRLYALEGTMPVKPGLVRDEHFRGPGIDVEIWAVPEDQFGSFVAGLPAPLGIGNAILEDGTVVKRFICEPYAVQGATEITRFGGWRQYLSQPLLTR